MKESEVLKLLDEILNHQVANRGTKDASYKCYTYNGNEMPAWVKKAEDILEDSPVSIGDTGNLPEFVSLGGTALRLNRDTYFRDAGNWGVRYRVIGGKLFSWEPHMGMRWLHNQPLVEITENEWRKDNGHYVTSAEET